MHRLEHSSPKSFDWLDNPKEWLRYSTPITPRERSRLVLGETLEEATPTNVSHASGEWLKDVSAHASDEVHTRGGIYTSQIAIEGMYCANCSLSIEGALKRLPGVLDVQVHAHAKKARIVWREGQSRPSAWLRAVHNLGYQSSLLEGLESEEVKSREAKLMLWRFMVALFCMMQIMMYSAPLYGDFGASVDPESIQLLHWAGWVLSLPVLIFSCQPFFMGALRDLKNLKLSMDLPVAIGMLLTFFLSCAVTFSPHDIWGMETYFDSLTMFATFLLGGRWLELKLRDKTLGALGVLMERIPKGIERQIEEGHFETISTHRIKVGDVLRIQPHQSFPCDGQLQSALTWVEESLLSGESNPIEKSSGATVLAGSTNLGPAILITVTQIGNATRFASIVHLLQEAESSKPNIAKIADQAAKPFIVTVLLAALISAVWWWPHSHVQALLVASAVLIVTCPCALTLATPSALIASAGFLAKHGVFMRDLATLERLSLIDVVVFDKTGTLTQNILHLREVFNASELSRVELFALARALAQHSPHPLSRSLNEPSNFAHLSPPQRQEMLALYEDIEVLDFKEMPGTGLEGTLRFKDKTLHLRLGSFKSLPPSLETSAISAMAQSAQVHLCHESKWLGSFLFDEELREEAQALVSHLQSRGLDVQIFSGDQSPRVEKIGQLLGLKPEQCMGQLSPQDKLQRIQVMQNLGHRVLMVGDGYNDLPILAGADVSLVFGSATHLAQEVANCVVLNPSLTWVSVCLNQAKASLRVVHQNLAWAFAYNLVCIPMALMGYLPSWLAGLGMALSSLGVVLNAYRLQLQPIEPIPDLSPRMHATHLH